MLALALFSLAATCAAAYPSEYFSDPISGQVVDARTNAPIAGVNVVLLWELAGPPEGHKFRLFHVEETLTGADGRYVIPGWGPLKRPSDGVLWDTGPLIVLFKSGYVPRQLGNDTPYLGKGYGISPPRDYDHNSALRITVWNGKTLELERFEGSTQEYAKKVIAIDASTMFLYRDCNWKRTPMLVRALDDRDEGGAGGWCVRPHDAGAHSRIPAQGGPLQAFR
jgi:hypothetical protein